MRAYLEAIRRCLLRRDAREARRLLDHPYGHSLSPRLRSPLADVAAGRCARTPLRALEQLREMQALMLDDDGAPDVADAAQLELALHPAPWSRPIDLTLARAAYHMSPRADGEAAPFPGLERAGGWRARETLADA